MEGKKRVVPREIWMVCPEKSNHCRETVLNIQKSAEVVVGKKFFFVKDRISRSSEYDRERRNDQI